MFGRKGLDAAQRPKGALFQQAEMLLPGDRVVGESIGARMSRELDMAIEGRARKGSDWHAPEGTMLSHDFLEGDIGSIRLAREGRLDLIADDADRRTLEGYAAVGGLPYERKMPSGLSKGPVSGPVIEAMSMLVGAGRER